MNFGILKDNNNEPYTFMFGIETWGSAKKSLISKVQQLQDRATKLSVSKQELTKSNRQRRKLLNWLSVRQEITFATHVMTFKVLNWGNPQELASVMPSNTKSLRIKSHQKLGTKPKCLNRTALTRSSYRSRSYYYNTLPKETTTQPDLIKFKKSLKNHMKTNPHQQLWEWQILPEKPIVVQYNTLNPVQYCVIYFVQYNLVIYNPLIFTLYTPPRNY